MISRLFAKEGSSPARPLWAGRIINSALALLALFWLSSVQAMPVDTRLELASQEVWTLDLPLQAGDYLRGYLSSNSGIQAVIRGAGGRPVKYLAQPGAREAFIYFSPESAGPFRLEVQAEEAAARVQLQLEKVPLSVDEPVAASHPLSTRVGEARQALDAGEDPDAVWSQLVAAGTPLIETSDEVPHAQLQTDERLVTFLWRGAQQQVLLFGGPSYEHAALKRLGATDIWYLSYSLPVGTRMSYQLAADVPQIQGSAREQRVAILSRARQDPHNPHSWQPYLLADAYNTRSFLELEVEPPAVLQQADQSLPEVQSYQLASELLGNQRSVQIFMPQALQAEPGSVVPLAIFFDGDDYLSQVPTPRILNNLISAGRIPPLVAVFVSNPNRAARTSELPCNPVFADFMAKELLPWIGQTTGFHFQPEKTLLAGASFGGLAAACTAFHHPENFGLVLSQSGSFWWSPEAADRPEWFNAQVAETERKPLRFYLSAGLFETDFGESGILNANRQLAQLLEVKGYPVILEEFSAGHDYFHWRATLHRGLLHLLGSLQ
ncbi:alpha/beta hydrolase-fold protein [Marinospirillum perlucidum]|uniref:alpha/beta hydrolase-fold protein n=1 Tax=Marinospirillum perlucidum TaxID=1982602 RepID=UPI00138FDD9D|nr:alpha/beta hydrolase-fold protein [Marinospirillum perlucidum]